jgi:serine/alanine adding enzyme
MRVVKNSAVDLTKWESLIHVSNFSSPFQTPAFYNLFNTLKGYSADVFAVQQDQSYTGLIVVTVQREKGIKGFFSRRGIVYGGPLIYEDGGEILSLLLSEIINYYNRALIYIEVRNYFDYREYQNAYTNNGFIYKPWLNFQMPTIDKVSLQKKMSSSRLRQIKKAFKNGVTFDLAKNEIEVLNFYHILKELYSSKIGKPLFSKEFFITAFSNPLYKYLLVKHEDQVIGGIMCAVLENKTVYEMYICGLDDKYKELYPSVIATWAGIEYANKNNIPLFDFMGAGSPNDDYGVREFKSRFGGELVEFGRFLKVLNPLLFKFGQIGLRLLIKVK